MMKLGAATVPPMTRTSEEELAKLLVASTKDGTIGSLVEERFDAINQDVLKMLTQDDDLEGSQAAMSAVKDATDKRMSLAKERLEHVLDAGELLEMDRRLAKLFRDGVVDAAFLVVLNMNAASTAEMANEGDEAAIQRARIFEHLYTRAQEEWEKRLPDQAKGVLHRLARTTDPQIRRNILQYYLAPKTELDVPGKDPVPLDTPQPPLLSAPDLATAIADAVASLRTLDVDGDMIRDSIEDMRSIAKEARFVLIATADESVVRQFEADLSTTWPPH